MYAESITAAILERQAPVRAHQAHAMPACRRLACNQGTAKVFERFALHAGTVILEGHDGIAAFHTAADR